MSNYSEMDFLFGSVNKVTISNILNNTSQNNTVNIIKGGNNYVVYKYNRAQGFGTEDIKKYLESGNTPRSGIYKNENGKNPYVALLEDFNTSAGTSGAGLRLHAADFAYLRELGVYPMNRMAILRRFPVGCSLTENLEDMLLEPISTIVGWIKPDANFGNISFNENWGKTTQRFDVLLNKIINDNFKIDISSIVPIPDFAQGVLFEFYKQGGFTQSSGINDSVNEIEQFDSSLGVNNKSTQTSSSNWGLNNIPVGNPDVLQEGPYRDPVGQNIQSQFSFELTTTYEQKLLGDVDPGSAMLDILDNIYTMGTSNMLFYWGDSAPAITKARTAANEKGNELTSWWVFVENIMIGFWDGITGLFKEVKAAVAPIISSVQQAISPENAKDLKDKAADVGGAILNVVVKAFQTILTSTVAIHRFELRGSIELMVGGNISSTPWYLTIGNPYAPWLATNHIIIKSASIETSTEMGFNDQPQWLTAKFTCEFSRSLGKQELMRMFNNTYRRTYSQPPKSKMLDEVTVQGQYTKRDPHLSNITVENTKKTPGQLMNPSNKKTG